MPLILEGDICLPRMLEVANTLRAAVPEGAEVELDGAAITAIDFAGIQLLVATRRSSLQSGGDFRVIVPPTGPLRDALAAHGFADLSRSGDTLSPFVDGALQ